MIEALRPLGKMLLFGGRTSSPSAEAVQRTETRRSDRRERIMNWLRFRANRWLPNQVL